MPYKGAVFFDCDNTLDSEGIGWEFEFYHLILGTRTTSYYEGVLQCESEVQRGH